MKCPICGSLNFFIKDPHNQYETYEFVLKGQDVVFDAEAAESDATQVSKDTEVFCEKCSWHDTFQELKSS